MVKKILLVDDDLYIRDVYDELLKDQGFEVDTASDGQQGLEKISQGGYDLILLDLMMPKIDGFGVLTKLSENPPKKPNGNIILLTNLANDPIVNQCLEKGAKEVFIKSDHTPEDLLNLTKKYLSV